MKPVTIQTPVSISDYKLNTIQTPIYDTKFETIQTPVYNTKFDTLQTPVVEYGMDTIQTPVQAFQVDTIQETALALETIQTPVMSNTFSFPPYVPITPSYSYFRLPKDGGRSGGDMFPGYKKYGKGYRFRTWDVASIESLLPGMKKNKYFTGW